MEQAINKDPKITVVEKPLTQQEYDDHVTWKQSCIGREFINKTIEGAMNEIREEYLEERKTAKMDAIISQIEKEDLKRGYQPEWLFLYPRSKKKIWNRYQPK